MMAVDTLQSIVWATGKMIDDKDDDGDDGDDDDDGDDYDDDEMK